MSTRPKIVFLKAGARQAPGGGIGIDDYATGFEGTLMDGWTQVSSGATIATSSLYKKYGLQSLRILCPTLASYGYLYRGIHATNSGLVKVLCCVYVDSYLGTTSNDYQYALAYISGTGWVNAGWLIRATDLIIYHQNVSDTLLATPLAEDTWYELLCEMDFANLKTRFYIDNALVKQYSEAAMTAPDRYLFGDGSATVMRGDFYWDSMIIGRAAG